MGWFALPGAAAAFNKFADNPTGFKSFDRDDDFDLNSGYFAAFSAKDLQVKVIAFDDGERVATKGFTLDLRGGSGNLDRGDEWSFCLTAARMAAEQERR